MYASAYTPLLPGQKPTPGVKPVVALDNAAKAFEKLYPGIHIEFLPNTSTEGTNQWYETEGAAGQLPDISWVQGPYVNIDYPKGLFTDLLPYFQQPNPFIPGNKKWINTMNPEAVDSSIVPGVKAGTTGVYAVDGDWEGFGFWYNKALFKEAGITKPPTTWGQLVTDSQELKAHGIDPGATFGAPIYNWFAHIFQPNALGASRMRTILGVKGNTAGAVTSEENAYFYNHYGDWLNPSKDPALIDWWPAAKALLSTWDPATIDVTETNASTAPSPYSLFTSQQVAMVYVEGSDMPKLVYALPKKHQFPFGMFNPTSVMGTSKYATNLVTYQDVGGPYVGFQFAISTHLADSTMTPAKFKAALAWLQFITTPHWDQTIVNEEENAIPIIKGTTAPPVDRTFQQAIDKYPFWSLSAFDTMTSTSFDTIDGLFLEYVNGFISFKTAEKEYDADAAQIVAQFDSQNAGLMAKFTQQENARLGIK
ncbi:MAG: hypothetical protein C7B45_09875 [Sulfobacillus acidophilus]|uniref:ABC transporter substrate-binding protein n=1 Tax=Sulfobacillus acidophilus TaxID=53633 RepID=A0A2T2WHK4_9FIRM|nr:MAG: hypothetical protein C7B45_09875 [Sulfobacillus acidophilus]